MSSDPMSADEQPEIDDRTLSEVVRRPTRTAGDLSEVADASPGITTEDLARDLEAVASKRGDPTDSELLANLLRRVERIEEVSGTPWVLRSNPALPGAHEPNSLSVWPAKLGVAYTASDLAPAVGLLELTGRIERVRSRKRPLPGRDGSGSRRVFLGSSQWLREPPRNVLHVVPVKPRPGSAAPAAEPRIAKPTWSP